MIRRLLSLVSFAAIVAVPCVPGTISGQARHVWLEPRFGWLVPTRDLGRTDVLGGSGFGIFDRADQTAVLGVAVGVELGGPWALRSSWDRSLDASVPGEWRCVPFIACPAVLLPLEGELSRWTAGIDVLFRPATIVVVDPIVFAGVGVRRSRLVWGEPEADVTLPAFSFSETEAVYGLGVGVERSLGKLKLFGEVEATAVRFGGGRYDSIEGNVPAERKLALDVGFLAGVRVLLR
jgi:hypothetical protein